MNCNVCGAEIINYCKECMEEAEKLEQLADLLEQIQADLGLNLRIEVTAKKTVIEPYYHNIHNEEVGVDFFKLRRETKNE